jgi:Uncharacterized protein conserved in bacteria (DUF2188)
MVKSIRKGIQYTPSLGRAIARKAKRARADRFHLISSISDVDKWSLVPEGGVKSIRVFMSKSAALDYVKNIKRESGKVYVVIHGKDGTVEDRVTFLTQ